MHHSFREIILSIEDLLIYVEHFSPFSAIFEFFLPITYLFSIDNRLKAVNLLHVQYCIYVAMKDCTLNHRLVVIRSLTGMV